CLLFFFFSSRRRHTRCLSDWSSDVCSSDLDLAGVGLLGAGEHAEQGGLAGAVRADDADDAAARQAERKVIDQQPLAVALAQALRSEEHTSELQSLRHLVCRLLLEKKKKVCKRPARAEAAPAASLAEPRTRRARPVPPPPRGPQGASLAGYRVASSRSLTSLLPVTT